MEMKPHEHVISGEVNGRDNIDYQQFGSIFNMGSNTQENIAERTTTNYKQQQDWKFTSPEKT